MSQELTRAAPEGVRSVTGRRADLRLYAWGDIAEHTDEGIREQLLPGVFADVDPTRVTLESQRHGGALVGVGESLQEREDGIHSTFRIAQTPAGDELLALISPGPEGEPPVLRDASVVFKPQGQRIAPGGIVQRTAADLRRVAIVERGAYPSAVVTAVRSEPDMSEITEQPLEQAPPPVVERAEPEQRAEPEPSRIDALEDRISKLVTLASVPSASDHPMAKYGSLSEYTNLVYRGEAEADLMYRTLTEQETGNNAGVIPENWLKDVKRIVNLGRRGISAFGGPRPLGDKGMTVDYPYLNSSNTLTAAQTEGAEVQTAQVDIAKGSEDILTFAGGSRITYQLAQRSDPSYREAYDRIVLASWAKLTDANFISQLEADASGSMTLSGMLGADIAMANPSAAADNIFDTTPDHDLNAGDAVVFTSLTGGTGVTAGKVYWVVPTSLAAKTFRVAATPGGAAIEFSTNITAGNVNKVNTSGVYFRSALFEASVAIEDATGMPAGAVVASTDVFLALAGLSDFVALLPSGVHADSAGLLNAATLRMESSGLEIVRDDSVSDGKVIIGNSMAAGWHEAGPKWATADDVSQLGTNVAVYSFGAGTIYVPAGIVEATFI